jgi:glycosyltransferase involved in cell wall biosynthesis
MKIVAHNGATIWGGAERATTRLLTGLKARGHEVLLLCNSPVVMEKADDAGLATEQLIIGGDAQLHHAFRLRRILRTVRPDAFIVGTYKKLFIASLGARYAGVPRIVARVGLESDTPRSWKYRYALRKWTDSVVVNSTSIANSFIASGVDGARVRVIHNGVAPLVRTVEKTQARKAFGLPPDAVVIGAAARLAIQKRIDRLAEAVAILPQNVHCIVAGEGTRRSDIESVVRQKNLSSRFHLTGHLDNIQNFLSALDIYVVSSNSEGLSNSMLEAMSLGIPVVSTDVSGARDALIAGNDSQPGGIIVERDAAAIAAGVRRLADDDVLRAAMGASARERAVGNFSLEKMLDQWERFLSGPA